MRGSLSNDLRFAHDALAQSGSVAHRTMFLALFAHVFERGGRGDSSKNCSSLLNVLMF